MLRSVSGSSVSRLAAISGRAAFLAPPIVILPARGRLPRMRILSMDWSPDAPAAKPARHHRPAIREMWQKSLALRRISQFRQGDAALAHVFPLAVGIGGLARLLAAEEEE